MGIRRHLVAVAEGCRADHRQGSVGDSSLTQLRAMSSSRAARR
jgi:hypothetical protein